MSNSPNDPSRYHHGNLRAALLQAAEIELDEKGLDHFSLRGVAKRAGVSHGAPAHHFSHADDLLTALAALSFERFLDAMQRHAYAAGGDPVERLVESGIGYIGYAAANPAMFDLQFFSGRVRHTDPALSTAASAAFAHLNEHVTAVLPDGCAPQRHRNAVASMWATAHGLATLFERAKTDDDCNGKGKGLFGGIDLAERTESFRTILRQTIASL